MTLEESNRKLGDYINRVAMKLQLNLDGFRDDPSSFRGFFSQILLTEGGGQRSGRPFRI